MDEDRQTLLNVKPAELILLGAVFKHADWPYGGATINGQSLELRLNIILKVPVFGILEQYQSVKKNIH